MFKKFKVCLSALLCLSILLCGNVFASEPATVVGLDGTTASNSSRAYTTGEVLITNIIVYPTYDNKGDIEAIDPNIYVTKSYSLSSGSGLYISRLSRQALIDKLEAKGLKHTGWIARMSFRVDCGNQISWTHNMRVDDYTYNHFTGTVPSGAVDKKIVKSFDPMTKVMSWNGYLTVRLSNGQLATRSFGGTVGFTDQ